MLFPYTVAAAAAAKLLQLCPTLCNPIDGSPPGILQARTLEWCYFLLQCMKVKSQSEVAQSCPTLSDPMDCSSPRLLRPWDFPGKSTGVGCHCLLQFPFYSYLFPPPPIQQGQTETQMFHCCSVTRLCLTLCDLMDYSTPSCSVFHYLQESESVSCLVLSDSL